MSDMLMQKRLLLIAGRWSPRSRWEKCLCWSTLSRYGSIKLNSMTPRSLSSPPSSSWMQVRHCTVTCTSMRRAAYFIGASSHISKTPEYITELLTIRASTRALRSNDGITLEVPRSRTRYGDRAFSRCGPRIWNSLPLDIRQSTSEQIFRKKLKTFLFSQAFSV